ncbi:Rieske (2Fe-2S) protein [Algoriphagus aestuariicola]|uniref:Rieske (2Fe-2S) protein n=1 Tax=Algoriphagus aestuariicola TaxID=1852016 RepID=A0ABS3BKX5_9BACT|nr:Rieske (2Fe-2S) protein [Algoriphagus aestuariicola]MBN7799959.1 Rieske (2Fe-2S) protein [Algoriphagus aestuariicola]
MENSTQIVSGRLSKSRRDFLEEAGLGLVYGTLGLTFFTSCSSTEDADPVPKTPSGNTGNAGAGTGITISGNTVTIDLTIQTGLAASGGWLLIVNAKVLVANVGGSYTALTSVCTHQGCSDSWTFSSGRYTCNCHGSVFNSSGAVLSGPATQNLDQYSASVSGNTLTIVR